MDAVFLTSYVSSPISNVNIPSVFQRLEFKKKYDVLSYLTENTRNFYLNIYKIKKNYFNKIKKYKIYFNS
jgi:hypothetical protein